ncbi:MAG: hypothetical protein ACTH1D_11735 [Mycobacteriaceae bacterium]|uniref:hypothetical protein n=1 Tax=Corynebacterium sp. TaxID=1720 RepID=UPI003F9B46FC
MAVVSVVGPDAAVVEQVASGLRGGGQGGPHRFVAGAGPGEADGVVAVVAGDGGGEDAGVVRAVRDAMGVCVLYTGGSPVIDEPGVVVCRWSGTVGSGIDALRDTLQGMWVDVGRWTSDARRADADRLDRVRIAVRLAAERIATELLGGSPGSGVEVGPGDAAVLDAGFRARISVAVLEQGVEMPHLPVADVSAIDPAGQSPAPSPAGGRQAGAVTAMASVGAGLAVTAAVARMAGSPVLGAAVGVPVAAGTFAARWWTQRSARRTQDASRRAAALRRHWAATVTEVVARLDVPAVADTLGPLGGPGARVGVPA